MKAALKLNSLIIPCSSESLFKNKNKIYVPTIMSVKQVFIAS